MEFVNFKLLKLVKSFFSETNISKLNLSFYKIIK